MLSEEGVIILYRVVEENKAEIEREITGDVAKLEAVARAVYEYFYGDLEDTVANASDTKLALKEAEGLF